MGWAKTCLIGVGVALLGCGGGIRHLGSSEHGTRELERLHEEGWLQAFRDRTCMTLGRDEVPERPGHSAPITPQRTFGPDDIIGNLATGVDPRRRSDECTAAAIRFRDVQEYYRSVGGEELLAFNEAIGVFGARMTSMTPMAPHQSPLPYCPLSDNTVWGAELAVARFLYAVEPFPHGPPLADTQHSCILATLGGSVQLVADPSDLQRPEPVDSGGFDPPAVAFDQIAQSRIWAHGLHCTQQTEGCDQSCRPEDASCCPPPYLDVAPTQPHTATVVVMMVRAAMGCGSVVIRAFHLSFAESTWQVIGQTELAAGNHGQ